MVSWILNLSVTPRETTNNVELYHDMRGSRARGVDTSFKQKLNTFLDKLSQN